MMPDHHTPPDVYGCGQRLREARMAAGLTIDDVAARLKMPVRVVESLEAEDWQRLGAAVYVRGQLRSYARLLGLSTDTVHAAVAPVEPVDLVPRTYVPRVRILAEQFARRLVYMVITAAIALPVWLATRPHLGTEPVASAPLDVPASSDGQPAVAQRPAPYVASLAPVAQRVAGVPARRELVIALEGESWVELRARDGAVTESALLPAGTERRLPLDAVGMVVLGNAGAARLRIGGEPVDLAPYLRANVARFTVSSDGSLAPAGP
jgi:cytoskeleton protein RodZ